MISDDISMIMIDNVWYECDISGEDVARCCKMGVSGEDVLGSAHGSSMSGVMIVELVDGAGFHGWNILSSHIVSKKAAKWHATSCNHQSIGGLNPTNGNWPSNMIIFHWCSSIQAPIIGYILGKGGRDQWTSISQLSLCSPSCQDFDPYRNSETPNACRKGIY